MAPDTCKHHEAVEVRVCAIKKEQERRTGIINGILDKLDAKVSQKVFFWMLALIATVLLSVGGAVWKMADSLHEVDKTMSVIQEQVQTIQKSITYFHSGDE